MYLQIQIIKPAYSGHCEELKFKVLQVEQQRPHHFL